MTRPLPDRGLVGRVRRLIAGETAEKRTPEAVSAPLAKGEARADLVGSVGPSAAKALEDRLHALLQRQSTVSAGRVQIIGLEAIRERLGGKWERYSGRVHTLVETTLRQRLSAVDICTRLADLAYVIVFTELTEEEAAVKCAIIQHEIEAALFGEDADTNELSVAATVATLDALAIAGNESAMAGIEKILDNRFSQNLRDHPHDDRNQSDRADHAVCQASIADMPLTRDQVVGPDLSELFRPPDLSAVEFRFFPIWHVRQNALLGFLCVPAYALKSGDIAMGHEILGRRRDNDLLLDLDTLVLSRTLAELRSLASKGQRLLIACQINFETLRRPEARRTIAQSCQSLPEPLRQLLVIEITGMPDGVPVSVVQEIDMTLRGICRHVTWHTAMREQNLNRIVEAGAKRIGFVVGSQRRDEAYLLGLLEQFATRAHTVGLRAVVHGIHTTSLATSAVCSGFDEISGNAISPMVNRIHPGREYTPVHVVASLLASGNPRH